MWPTTEIMRRLVGVVCGMLLLAGCATPPASRVPLSAQAQEQLLRSLNGFRLEGRAFIAAGDGVNATLNWIQRGADSELRLAGPFGVGSLMLRFGPDALLVSTSQGDELEGAEAARVLADQLGFMPPLEALRYWVLGLHAPGDPPTHQTRDAAGHVTDMIQHDWHIRYDRWSTVATRDGEVQVPRRMSASRATLELRVVVDRWALRLASR